jgi:pimeloyl-ACP methyl ester carboxylesterase
MSDPFQINVPDGVLHDLNERLARARWPDQVAAYGWEQGTEPGYLRELVAYWRDEFDWRRQEALLNGFSHFTARFDHGRVHFIHERSRHPQARPLLLLHGWPGSVFEFHRLIPRLTRPEEHGGTPAEAFHVVAPSLPGYGFSAAPREPGFTPRRMAQVMNRLMRDELGYSRYFAQGGDWGSVICSWLGVDAAPSVAAIHLNMAGLRPSLGPDAPPLTEEEKAFLAAAQQTIKEDMAYMAIQGTRPQTLGYGLNDSPVGLAAWIVEKFRAWTDCGGDLERSVSKDELLTNIMIYWVTGTITSSVRLYYEFRHADEQLSQGERVECPTGYADFPGEIFRPPRSWLERAYDLRQWTEMKAGGHFAALEAPDALAEDVRRFFAGYAL